MKNHLLKDLPSIDELMKVDALAAAATFIMGEGNQKNPIVIVRNIRSITFNSKDTRSKLFPDKQSDMFAPLLKLFRINKK